MLTQISNRFPVLIKSALDRKLDATELLMRDHMKVEGHLLQLKLLGRMAQRFESRWPARMDLILARRQKIFAEMRRTLEKHMLAEESAFYPEVRKIQSLDSKIEQSYDEHSGIKAILMAMESMSIDSSEFDLQLDRLIEHVRHHVREEEEGIFPRLRLLMPKIKLEKLAIQLKGAKKVKKKVEKKTGEAA